MSTHAPTTTPTALRPNAPVFANAATAARFALGLNSIVNAVADAAAVAALGLEFVMRTDATTATFPAVGFESTVQLAKRRATTNALFASRRPAAVRAGRSWRHRGIGEAVAAIEEAATVLTGVSGRLAAAAPAMARVVAVWAHLRATAIDTVTLASSV